MKREDGSGLAFDRLERLAKARNIPVIDLYVICDRTRTVPPAPQEQADAPSVLLDPSVELALLQKPGPQPTGSLLVPRQHEISPVWIDWLQFHLTSCIASREQFWHVGRGETVINCLDYRRVVREIILDEDQYNHLGMLAAREQIVEWELVELSRIRNAECASGQLELRLALSRHAWVVRSRPKADIATVRPLPVC